MTDNEFKQLFNNNILKAIQIGLENIVNNCDKTLQGRIVSFISLGMYKVNIQGVEYSAPCININDTYSNNQTVWVTLPQGKWDEMFITGRRV